MKGSLRWGRDRAQKGGGCLHLRMRTLITIQKMSTGECQDLKDRLLITSQLWMNWAPNVWLGFRLFRQGSSNTLVCQLAVSRCSDRNEPWLRTFRKATDETSFLQVPGPPAEYYKWDPSLLPCWADTQASRNQLYLYLSSAKILLTPQLPHGLSQVWAVLWFQNFYTFSLPTLLLSYSFHLSCLTFLNSDLF